MTTYAGERFIHDTDSHLMEPVDWLANYADGATAEKLRDLSLAGGGDTATLELVEQCWERRTDPDETAKLVADVVNGPKGYFAYGSMDANERVGSFSTSWDSPANWCSRRLRTPSSMGAKTSTWCTAAPRRTTAVSRTSARSTRGCSVWRLCRSRIRNGRLNAPARPSRLGCRAAWIPHGVPTELSPTHPDFDPLWALLSEASVPVLMHLGPNGGKPAAEDVPQQRPEPRQGLRRRR